MRLVLRSARELDKFLARLEGIAGQARVLAAGERPIVEVAVQGYSPEAFLRWEEVERVLPAGEELPLVRSWNGTVHLGTWDPMQEPLLIAGPCSVEDRKALLTLARELKALGVQALRGGAFKARTSPYAFQGLGEKALDWLLEAKAETGLPLCVEVLSEQHLPLYDEVDLLQIGARNMDHYWLLKEVAALHKPVLLKRNPQATVEEFLLAAEYLLLHGAPGVFLCERGIRTFERSLRYTLDVGALPVIQAQTRLPVVVDPSHAAGRWPYVEPLALAGLAAGALGLLVEVHLDPGRAYSDAAQQLTLDQFALLVERARLLYRTLSSRGLAEPLQGQS